ncbi:MAG: ABC transporter substrate-binding protein [Gammaproteobacteria bacterium]|nr:ABC transporter substrate-binding protein [Gammaproteobacteria bacterium]
MRTVFSKFSLVLFGLLAMPSFAADMPDPEQFILDRADAILERIDSKREAIRADQAVANRIVEEELLPHIDVDYISRLVLGKHWRSASDAEREQFVAAFKGFLLRSYAQGLAEFTRDKFKVLPLRGEANPKRTIIQLEIYREQGAPVPVAFTLRWTGEEWLVYDVIIEGISYVRNYRTDFNTEIEQKGLGSVIERLQGETIDAGLSDGSDSKAEG